MVKIRLLVLLLIAAFLGTLIPALRARHVLTVQAAAPAVMAEGDREVAFFHTSTSTSNWERLIAGLHHSARDLPGLKIDDLRAFLDQTTAIPEVAIHREGCPGRLVVRWYKLGGGLGHREWIQALAKRDIPPIAVLGGGSSDRAVDLAKVLQAQETWNGPRPLFLISTATVNQLDPLAYPDTAEQLMQIYPGRSFRFCYHNQQMAHAVLDFLFRAPATQDLRPAGHPRPEAVAALIGVAPNWPTLLPFAQRALKPTRVQVFSLAWRDDPYSLDLADQFENELKSREGSNDFPETQLSRSSVPYSVGRFRQVNRQESELIEGILRASPRQGQERGILLLPTVAPPARRILQALTAEAPFIGQHLIMLNGDGISMNNVYRDWEIAWNFRELPVPMIFFCHQNPIAWDGPEAATQPGNPAILRPPTSTEDVLLMGELLTTVAEGCLRPDIAPADAEGLRQALTNRQPPIFDEAGNRLSGGEYVGILRPKFDADPASGLPRIAPTASIEVWRQQGEEWRPVSGMKLPPTP